VLDFLLTRGEYLSGFRYVGNFNFSTSPVRFQLRALCLTQAAFLCH